MCNTIRARARDFEMRWDDQRRSSLPRSRSTAVISLSLSALVPKKRERDHKTHTKCWFTAMARTQCSETYEMRDSLRLVSSLLCNVILYYIKFVYLFIRVPTGIHAVRVWRERERERNVLFGKKRKTCVTERAKRIGSDRKAIYIA